MGSHPLPNGMLVAKAEERPARHPDSPAERKMRGSGEGRCKSKPTSNIVRSGPEAQRRTWRARIRMAKCKNKPTLSLDLLGFYGIRGVATPSGEDALRLSS